MQVLTSKSYNPFPVPVHTGTGNFAYIGYNHTNEPNFRKSGSVVERITGVAPERLGERLRKWSNDFAPERLGKSTRTIFNFYNHVSISNLLRGYVTPAVSLKVD